MVAITKELCCGFGDFLVGQLVCFVGFWGNFFAAEKKCIFHVSFLPDGDSAKTVIFA